MRHQIFKKKFNRNFKHKKSMLKNLLCNLIIHEKILTTSTKAKFLQRYIEPLITKSKTYTLSKFKYIYDIIRNKKLVHKMFTHFGPKFIDQNGGYTKVIKYGYRKGDNAQLSIIKIIN